MFLLLGNLFIIIYCLDEENETDLNDKNPVDENNKEYVNGQGVRFTTQIPIPYTSK